MHGVSGMTKAAGKGVQPKKHLVGKSKLLFGIRWINSYQLFLMKKTGAKEGIVRLKSILLSGAYSSKPVKS